MMFLAQLETVTKLVDHAAQQDMRWWFLGALMSGGAGLMLLARYWTQRHDRLSDRLDRVQDAHTAYLQQGQAKLAEVVGENAAAMREFSHAISAVEHLFARK